LSTGRIRYHQELLREFPSTILDLLRLQGIGPKTVARLYGVLGVKTLEELEDAARDGRVRAMPGMGAKKEALILKAIADYRRYGPGAAAGAMELAATLDAELRQ